MEREGTRRGDERKREEKEEERREGKRRGKGLLPPHGHTAIAAYDAEYCKSVIR